MAHATHYGIVPSGITDPDASSTFWTKEYGENFCTFMVAICCPCATTAYARTNWDDSNYLFNCCFLPLCVARNAIRESYHIQGDCFEDMILSCVCQPCVAAQLIAEVEARGPVPKPAQQQPWAYGLLDSSTLCEKHFDVLVYACCCPYCAAAAERSSFDGSDWTFNTCCLPPVVALNLIREGYNIEGTCCGDLLLTQFCFPCAVVQMHAEILQRGPRFASLQNPPAPSHRPPPPDDEDGDGQCHDPKGARVKKSVAMVPKVVEMSAEIAPKAQAPSVQLMGP